MVTWGKEVRLLLDKETAMGEAATLTLRQCVVEAHW